MFLTAPETKGFTLEEMDEVFDSGIPAWRKAKQRSRLDDLEAEIAEGNLKITGAGKTGGATYTQETTEKV